MAAVSLLQYDDSITQSLGQNMFASMPKSTIEDKICQIARRMHIHEPDRHIGLLVENAPAVTPYATVLDPEKDLFAISVPYTFLLNTGDVESLFQGRPPKIPFPMQRDPRAYTKEQLIMIHNALQDKLGLPRTSLSLQQQEGFRLFLKYIQDPVKSEQAKTFTLGHEVAHIAYKHICREPPTAPAAARPLDKMGVVGSVIKKGLAKSMGSMAKHREYHLTHELEAERSSVIVCKDMGALEGGIYLFRTLNEFGRAARESSVVYRAVFSDDGSFRFDYTHPSSGERLSVIDGYARLPDDNMASERRSVDSQLTSIQAVVAVEA